MKEDIFDRKLTIVYL